MKYEISITFEAERELPESVAEETLFAMIAQLETIYEENAIKTRAARGKVTILADEKVKTDENSF